MPRDPDNMFGGEPPRGDHPGRQHQDITIITGRRHRLRAIVSAVGVLLVASAVALAFGWVV